MMVSLATSCQEADGDRSYSTYIDVQKEDSSHYQQIQKLREENQLNQHIDNQEINQVIRHHFPSN